MVTDVWYITAKIMTENHWRLFWIVTKTKPKAKKITREHSAAILFHHRKFTNVWQPLCLQHTHTHTKIMKAWRPFCLLQPKRKFVNTRRLFCFTTQSSQTLGNHFCLQHKKFMNTGWLFCLTTEGSQMLCGHFCLLQKKKHEPDSKFELF